ncbi:cell wall metabolism sensor histidine kinase WalK [Candidatus Saccharibacteria bacterium]|nr:cell wall metabolism sensor histidine kinase WalK [Candidatus Saccharibacteria bacterium]
MKGSKIPTMIIGGVIALGSKVVFLLLVPWIGEFIGVTISVTESLFIVAIVILAGVAGWMIGRGMGGSTKTTRKAGRGGVESALRSEAVVDSISDGIIVLDGDGNVTLINPAAIELIGWGKEDAVGLSIQSVLVLMNEANMPFEEGENPILQTVKMKTPYESRNLTLVTKVTHKNIPIALSVSPAGENSVVTFRDIEREVSEGQERSDFISTASHEMRTPVASIEGYLGLALNPQTATIDERARQYLARAHESSQHLGRLFADLLDVTRLDDQRIKVRMEPIETLGFVRNIYEAMKPAVKEKGLQYVFRPDVRNEKVISPAYYSQTDVVLLREVVSNLIENAIKYNREGGSIEVDVSGNENNVTISVVDTGIGIPPEDVAHVFQKFYRVDSTDTREIGGTGLGLYISRQRVENINGKIWVESEYQKGSTFFVSIPRLSGNMYEMILKEKGSNNAANEQKTEERTNTTTVGTGAYATMANHGALQSNYAPINERSDSNNGVGMIHPQNTTSVISPEQQGVAE